MKKRSGGVSKKLLAGLLEDQARRAQREKEMLFADKLRVVDRLMAEGPPKVEGEPSADLPTRALPPNTERGDHNRPGRETKAELDTKPPIRTAKI